MTTEMMEDFAERRGINLIVLHGNIKIKHITGGSEQWLTYVQWDNHSYFVRNSHPFLDRPVGVGRDGEQQRV